MSYSEFQLIIDAGTKRVRLEEYLFDQFPQLSRMYIRDVIRDEKCEVNGRVENKGKRVRTGDFIEIMLELQRGTAMLPQPIPLVIVYEDDELIAVNKRPGMLVHPTHRQKSGTLLNALSFHLNRGSQEGTIRPGLIHRLDKETSGLMIVAKNLRAHRALAKQFQHRKVTKLYLALVEGLPTESTGMIEAPIGRFAEEKRWGIMVDGSPAVTRYRVVKTNGETTLLELQPVTGRTNQLRIHCESIGHPIVGDLNRGGKPSESLCLHSLSLQFRHPSEGRALALSTDAPAWAVHWPRRP